MRYWIDSTGTLWRGPTSPNENLHYSYFCGFTETPEKWPIWFCCRSSEPSGTEISAESAAAVMAKF